MQGELARNDSEASDKLANIRVQMDKPKETIRVLDNFDITLSLDSRADNGQQFSNIDIGIEQLVLRVSFRDILLINSILNRAIELSNRTPPEIPEEPARPPVQPHPNATSSRKAVTRSRSDPARRSISSRRRPSNAALKPQVIVTKETVRRAAGEHRDDGTDPCPLCSSAHPSRVSNSSSLVTCMICL